MRKLTSRLFLAALGAVAFSGACGGDDPAPVTPVNYVPLLTRPGGKPLGDSLDLLCNGTIALSAQIWRKPFADESEELQPVETANEFVLRPANACGSASRCGYLRFEALDEANNVLTATDTATTSGVLDLGPEFVPSGNITLRVSLIHGYDQTRFVNPDETEASSDASVILNPAAEPCADEGAGGVGGAPNESVGGAGAGGVGGEPGAGGFGGALGGAGGESLGGAPTLPLGGAGAGGA